MLKQRSVTCFTVLDLPPIGRSGRKKPQEPDSVWAVFSGHRLYSCVRECSYRTTRSRNQKSKKQKAKNKKQMAKSKKQTKKAKKQKVKSKSEKSEVKKENREEIWSHCWQGLAMVSASSFSTSSSCFTRFWVYSDIWRIYKEERRMSTGFLLSWCFLWPASFIKQISSKNSARISCYFYFFI